MTTQRINQISITIEPNFAAVYIFGDSGAELSYSAGSPSEVQSMFQNMCSNLRRDMDSYSMVPGGAVALDYPEDWHDFSYVIDDLYLGDYSGDVQAWCDFFCDTMDQGSIAYVSDVEISLNENNELKVSLYWDYYDEYRDRYNNEGAKKPIEFFLFNASSVDNTLNDIASTWADDFGDRVDYNYDPKLYLPEFGPDVDSDMILAAFHDLWDKNTYSSNVSFLADYLRELLASEVAGAYISQVEIDVEPGNDDCLVIRFSWDTFNNPAWNALIPDDKTGTLEFRSDSYGSVSSMLENFSRELPSTFSLAGIEFNPEYAKVFYSSVEEPVITENEFILAFSDLFNGVYYSNQVNSVVDKLERMLQNRKGNPITKIEYNITASGGDISFCADDFESTFSIFSQDSVLDTFDDIASNLASDCERSYVVFDPEIRPSIEAGYSNYIDLYEGYGYDVLLDIFYNLYEGIITDQAERLANWIASY